MKKKTVPKKADALRREYDFSKLEGRAVGKYYDRAKAGPIVVLLKPDDAKPKQLSAAQRKKPKAKRATRRTTRRS